MNRIVKQVITALVEMSEIIIFSFNLDEMDAGIFLLHSSPGNHKI